MVAGPQREPPSAEDYLRAHLYVRSELCVIPQPVPLVGPLHRSTYAIASGRDGSFKSFYALSLALHVATGTDYEGKPVTESPVLYIAAEGGPGFDARIGAWEKEHDITVQDGQLKVLTRGFSFYLDGDLDKFEALKKIVTELKPGLVVLDTLRRISGGADENGSSMGTVIDRIIELRETVAGCTVLVVAHTAKNDQDTRGYSGIEDDADTVLHVVRDKASMKVRVVNTKSKYGSPHQTQHLIARPVADSLILRPDAPEHPALAVPQRQLEVLRILANGQSRSAKDIGERTGQSSSTCRAALDRLLKKGYVARSGTSNQYTWSVTPACPRELLDGEHSDEEQ